MGNVSQCLQWPGQCPSYLGTGDITHSWHQGPHLASWVCTMSPCPLQRNLMLRRLKLWILIHPLETFIVLNFSFTTKFQVSGDDGSMMRILLGCWPWVTTGTMGWPVAWYHQWPRDRADKRGGDTSFFRNIFLLAMDRSVFLVGFVLLFYICEVWIKQTCKMHFKSWL